MDSRPLTMDELKAKLEVEKAREKVLKAKLESDMKRLEKMKSQVARNDLVHLLKIGKMKDKISGMGEASNVAHLMMQTHHDIVLDSLARNASLQQHEMAQFAEFAEFADISKELMTAKSADHAQGLHREIEETLKDIEKVSAEKMAVDEDNQRLDAEMEQIVMKHQEIDRDLQNKIAEATFKENELLMMKGFTDRLAQDQEAKKHKLKQILEQDMKEEEADDEEGAAGGHA